MLEEVYTGLNGLELWAATAYDPQNNVVHVLDVGRKGAPSVTNSIELIQPQIMERLGLGDGVSGYKWLLYGTDGIISAFDWGRFEYVPTNHPLVRQDFARRMKGREGDQP